MNLESEITALLTELVKEVSSIRSRLSSPIESTYLSFTEITEQYPVSREKLYRLKDDDILKVYRFNEGSKFIVNRREFEEILIHNKI